MEATFSRTQISASTLRAFVVALVAALLVGGAGGYFVRVFTFSASVVRSTPTTTQPFVVEPIPYSSPLGSPSPYQTQGPDGITIVP